jgi:hypothetical protein
MPREATLLVLLTVMFIAFFVVTWESIWSRLFDARFLIKVAEEW